MASQELAVRDDSPAVITESADIAKARAALEQIHDLATARDFSNKAAAAATYFKRAKETRHLADSAAEVQVWAERRAGWIIIDQGAEDEHTDVARNLGTNAQTVRRWLAFAKAEEALIDGVISELHQNDESVTATGVARRLQTKSLERVERGIYLNYLGRYVLRWRERGSSRQQLSGTDLRQAREHLLIVTGAAGPARKPAERGPKAEIKDAYDGVRVILQTLDHAYPKVAPDVRAMLERACGALYKAEDDLGRAMRAVELS